MHSEFLRIPLQLQARCPNPVGKGQCLITLLPAKPLGGQHQQAWEKQVWVREAHDSGAEGRWEAGSLFPKEEGGGELACCCSASLLQQQGIVASQETAPELFDHQRE